MSIFDSIRGPRVHDANAVRPVRVYVRRPEGEPGDVFVPHGVSARRLNPFANDVGRCRDGGEPDGLQSMAEEIEDASEPSRPRALTVFGMRLESTFEQSEDQVSSAIDKANDPNFYKDPFSNQSYMPSEADRIETSEQLKLLLDQRPPLSGFALTMRINSILGAAKDRARAEAQATQPQNQGGGGDFFSNLFGGIANFFENLFSKVLGVFSQLLSNPLGFIGGLLGL